MKLCVREVASGQGITISELQRRTLLPMSTTQRYWHGMGASGPLKAINLNHLETLCVVLDCNVDDLLKKEDAQQ